MITNVTNIGIIGTAGRKEDASKITRELYFKMVELIATTVYNSFNFGVPTLISGGAAVADHIAVIMFLARNDINKDMKLKLYLPCEFDISNCKFVEREVPYDVGKTANYYHKMFEMSTGIKSLQQLNRAFNEGAEIQIGKSFKSRNAQVAEESNVLFALTFGNGAKLKDGGTLDTMTKYQKSKGDKFTYHVDLNTMKLYNPAKI